jgi:glycosyltransferase involved in cell wall biosynthesis
MISILIPIYNFDTRKFITDLQCQAVDLKIDFEIVLVDDCSLQEFRTLNKTLSELPGVRYIQLEKNIGRSKIRNFLVSQSKYEKLLFADCDSETTDKYFIKNYIKTSQKADVVCGGTEYRKSDLKNKTIVFRVKYGIVREAISLTLRQKYPYQAFKTNNFLISKSVFKSIQFDEKLTEYGHEDTLFGCELARKNIAILHINNPLFHVGLETAEVFLEKTRKGLKNLNYITENYNYPELYSDIKLLRTAKNLKLFTPLIKLGFLVFKKKIEILLKSTNPNIFVFDLYKLGFYMSIKDTKID